MLMEHVIIQVYDKYLCTAFEAYEETVQQYSSIKIQDDKYSSSTRADQWVHSKHTTHGSFASSHPLFEFEIDILDIGATVTNMRYGFAAVDDFTNTAEVIPIGNTQPDEFTRALRYV